MAKKRARLRKARPLVGGFLERISVTAFEKYHREIADFVRSQQYGFTDESLNCIIHYDIKYRMAGGNNDN